MSSTTGGRSADCTSIQHSPGFCCPPLVPGTVYSLPTQSRCIIPALFPLVTAFMPWRSYVRLLYRTVYGLPTGHCLHAMAVIRPPLVPDSLRPSHWSLPSCHGGHTSASCTGQSTAFPLVTASMPWRSYVRLLYRTVYGLPTGHCLHAMAVIRPPLVPDSLRPSHRSLPPTASLG